jgi:glycosyltransferase involved in cell wall biosynthesis
LNKKFKILCVGPQWRGSNAIGLFKALNRNGHLIEVVDENYYINLSNQSLKVKFIDKLFRSIHIQEFNKAILIKAQQLNPDIVLVYKGAFVTPETLVTLKSKGTLLANFYPDVSFHTHGSLLQKTLPIYNHIFTTKTFGIRDMGVQLGIKNSSFIPHGFDPEIHRPIDITNIDTSYFKADVSFMGTYSDKKAKYLHYLKSTLPNINLKIWGGNWQACKFENLKSSIMYQPIFGDLYILGILSSKINLGLLSEKVRGASDGDRITSRTFHIPGAGGFLFHEKNEESVNYFKEDEEAIFFEDESSLADKVKFYLENEDLREKIRVAGHQRAYRDHSLDNRAEMVTRILTTYLK